jgi:hypothetical protein
MGSMGSGVLRVLGMASLGGGVSVAAAYQPIIVVFVGVVVTVVVAAVVFGVLLPAVWLRKPARRRAASEVLDRVLSTLRPTSSSAARGRERKSPQTEELDMVRQSPATRRYERRGA